MQNRAGFVINRTDGNNDVILLQDLIEIFPTLSGLLAVFFLLPVIST